MPSPGIFADTNVLLYVRDPHEAAKRARATAWHDRLWRDGTGRTSAQVISEYYVNLKRKAGPRIGDEQAWTDAARYLAWRPRAIDAEVLHAARAIERRYKVSWWDGLIVAAAQLQGCELLLTEDLQDGMAFGGLAVRSPFTLAVEPPAARYAPPPMLARLHRPRGRPRRRLVEGAG